MKKLLLLLIIIPTLAFSQYERNEIDEMTGDKVLITEPAYLFNKAYFSYWERLQIKLICINDTYSIGLLANYQNKRFLVGSDSEHYIKLEDGTIIKLVSDNLTIANEGGGVIVPANSSLIGATIYSVIKKEEIEAMSKSNVAKVRITTTDGFFELVPPKNYALKFKKVALDFIKDSDK